MELAYRIVGATKNKTKKQTKSYQREKLKVGC